MDMGNFWFTSSGNAWGEYEPDAAAGGIDDHG
jgi:hypothetical protein